MEKKSKAIVLSLSLMLASLSTAHANPTPETNSNPPVFSSTLPFSSPALSCAAETAATPRAAEQLDGIGYHYYGYCYSDCSPCWSGNHGTDCPGGYDACTSIPAC